MAWAMAAGAAISIGGGLIKGRKAKKAKRAAEEEKRRQAAAIKKFEASRQSPINPYSGVKNLADQVKDLSGNLSNPYANIGVATQAAEFQAEQSDMALAATLDTLQATGASAGGATALANAAARSKKEVSANIQQQEAQNEKLAAQGEADLQAKQMAEKARIQSIQISEGGREQQAQAQGRAFEFQSQEQRDQATLDRMAAGLTQSQANIANANAAQAANTGAIISGVGSMAGAVIGAGGFSKNPTADTGDLTEGFGGAQTQAGYDYFNDPNIPTGTTNSTQPVGVSSMGNLPN